MNNPDEFLKKAQDISKKGWQDFLKLDRLNQFNIVMLVILALRVVPLILEFRSAIPLIALLIETIVLGIFALSLKQNFRLSISITLGLLVVEYLSMAVYGAMFPYSYGYPIPNLSTYIVQWLFGYGYLDLLSLLIVAALSPLSIAVLNFTIPRNVFLVTWLLSLIRSLLIFMMVLLYAPVSIVAIWAVTIYLYRYERNLDGRDEIRFRYNRPFFFFGTILTESSLFFRNAQQHEAAAIESVRNAASQYKVIEVADMSITDIAPNESYNKQFLRASYKTRLETKISVIYHTETSLDTLYFKWWIMYQGRISLWDLLIYLFLSPLTFAFWIIGWLQGEYSIVAALSGDIKHTYDVLDIESFVIAFQQDFFHKLLDDLEALGVNVDSYREHPPVFNQFNLNGSGNIIGAIAQGTGSQATARVAANTTR